MPELYRNPFRAPDKAPRDVRLPKLAQGVFPNVGSEIVHQLGIEDVLAEDESERVQEDELESITSHEHAELREGEFYLDVPLGLHAENIRQVLAQRGRSYGFHYIFDNDGYLDQDQSLDQLSISRSLLQSYYKLGPEDEGVAQNILSSLKHRHQHARRIARIMSVDELIQEAFQQEAETNESYSNVLTAADSIGYRPAAFEEGLVFARDLWRPGRMDLPLSHGVRVKNGNAKCIFVLCSIISSYMWETTSVTTLNYDVEKTRHILSSRILLSMSGAQMPEWQTDDGILMIRQ